MQRALAGLWVAAGMGLCPAEATAGRLDSVRSEVRGGGDSDSGNSDSGSSGSVWLGGDYDDEDCCTSGVSGSSGSSGGGDWDTVTPPTPPPPMRFRRYPYEGGGEGYMFVAKPDEQAHPRKIAGQVWAEGARQGRGLWRSAGGLRVDGQIFGVDGDLSYYLEPAANDALYLGTANVSLIPLHRPRGLWRIGGGVNTMIDGRLPGEGSREYALGWNVTTSFEAFPTWPVVISGRLDAGRLYQAWMGRARGSIGVMLWRMELYGGYEHTQVGRVGMGGPTVGVRFWL